MVRTASKLEWCVVSIGKDSNWWVEKTSDPVNWDAIDGLSVLDPRQIAHMIEHLEQLRDYGFQMSLVDRAFYRFRIDKEIAKGKIRLVRVPDSLIDPGEPLFALPDIVDEEKGPYADLINQITSCRIKMLNDLIDFEQRLTVDELEEEIRESQNAQYMEGEAVHLFNELSAILEYVPEGYELDEDDEESISTSGKSTELDEEFPDLEIEDEDIEEDETMKWGEEEDDSEDEEGGDDFDDEDDDLPPEKSKRKSKSASTAKKKSSSKKKKA